MHYSFMKILLIHDSYSKFPKSPPLNAKCIFKLMRSLLMNEGLTDSLLS